MIEDSSPMSVKQVAVEIRSLANLTLIAPREIVGPVCARSEMKLGSSELAEMQGGVRLHGDVNWRRA